MSATNRYIMDKLQVFMLIVSLNVLLCSGSPLAVVQGSEGGKREPRQAGQETKLGQLNFVSGDY